MSLKSVLSGKKNLIYLGSFVVIVALIEVLIFNQGFLLGGLSGLEERELSINEGSLNQFHLEGGGLKAINNDPNVTFDNLNMEIDTIFIKCNNVVPGALGQVFYRNNKKDFNEFRSIQYDANLKTRTIHLPENQMIYSLRFDLTNVANDVVSCGEIVINPWSPFRTSKTRLAIYLGLLLLFILYIFKDIKPIKSIRQKTSPILKKMFDALSKVNTSLESKIEETALVFSNYFRNNLTLIFVLVLITVAAYGFELFNLNITIDEEYFAYYDTPAFAWITGGRWGMYFLNKYLLPYNVVPFVPLALALAFQIAGVLLMLKSWDVNGKLEQIAVGSICLTFPGLAYVYTFSTLNYGIGIGLFCVSLSLFIYTQSAGSRKLLAVIPATFAISIYQGLIPALVLIYLVYLINVGIREEKKLVKYLFAITGVHVLIFSLYYVITKLLFIIYKTGLSSYITGFFATKKLIDNLPKIFSGFTNMMTRVYFGDRSIYTFEVSALKVLVFVVLLGFALNLWRSRSSRITKILVILLAVSLVLLPFISGLLMNGSYDMRFLVGLPIALSGLTMLGLGNTPRFFRIFLSILAIFCVYQFTISTNRLFASSQIALEADRLLASDLIQRIEQAKEESGTGESLQYMEMIGYLDRPATELMPKASTFGTSFFEWDQGNTSRALAFMKTIGYQGLAPAKVEERIQLIEVSNSMPDWPGIGSVKVVGNIVLIKFGSYSDSQKLQMCASEQNRAIFYNKEFCNGHY